MILSHEDRWISRRTELNHKYFIIGTIKKMKWSVLHLNVIKFNEKIIIIILKNEKPYLFIFNRVKTVIQSIFNLGQHVIGQIDFKKKHFVLLMHGWTRQKC